MMKWGTVARSLHNLLCVVACIFLLAACKSNSYVDSNSNFMSCKLVMKMPREAGKGYDKVNGVVRMYKDNYIRISFRAPVVRSELLLIDYDRENLLLLNRMGKLYVKLVAEELANISLDNVKLLSFDEMANIFMEAAQEKRKRKMPASRLGIVMYPSPNIELTSFDSKPFRISKTQVSSKYKEVSLEEFYDSLFLVE